MAKTYFDQITASPAVLAEFLASIPALETPWDEAFQRTYCAACSAENCDAETAPTRRSGTARRGFWPRRWRTVETILCGDALEQLRTMEPESVHTCVTSPPYYNLRDYGAAGQIGMEETPEEYITKLVDVFREVRRVCARTGRCG